MRAALRPARPEDASPCAAILRAWIDETPWFPSRHPPSADTPFLAAKVAAGQVTVAEGQGPGLAGFLARDGDFVSCLYVAGPARGAGVGRQLLDHAKTRRARLSLWTFAANTGAQAFYRREGFAETRRTAGDNEEGLPDIEFVWHRTGGSA